MNNSELTPLVDSDYLVYRVGFAVKDDEPVEYALATVRTSVHNIWDRFPNSKQGGTLFLTGKGNFRDKTATIQVYKGNRDPANKPKYYTDIREYMINHHAAQVVDGMEAEDRVGIIQYAAKDKSTVIVGVDKDLNMLPGWHYNPVKDTFGYITMAEGAYNFWHQCLTGDRVDNILGLKGIGPKTADKILAECGKDWSRMHETVLAEYRKSYGNEAEAALHENATLLWILREEGVGYDGGALPNL